tara:strand:- start:2830 stop:3522 length:693 start_codon:yes stop_codon:yes gene_type:complete
MQTQDKEFGTNRELKAQHTRSNIKGDAHKNSELPIARIRGSILQAWEGARQEDAALLALIAKGDDRAFQEIVDRYIQPIWRLASNILNDRHEAEDVVQDVFMMLWDKDINWQANGAKFSTWLYRVVLNKCIDIKRKKSRQHLSDIDIPKLFEDERPDSHARLSEKQTSDSLLRAIETLSAPQQKALKLFYFEDLSLAQIAERMETTLDSVKSLLKRGRNCLKTTLNEASL